MDRSVHITYMLKYLTILWMDLLGGLSGDNLAYPTPISFGTDEYFTWFLFHTVWIPCWHIANRQLVVEWFENCFASEYFNPLIRFCIVFLGHKIWKKNFLSLNLSFKWPKWYIQLEHHLPVHKWDPLIRVSGKLILAHPLQVVTPHTCVSYEVKIIWRPNWRSKVFGS